MERKIDTDAPAENFVWNATKAETQSTTHLEDDKGSGKAVIIRKFMFKINPQTFRNNPPSKQQIFNAHLKQIEIMLWQDGMKVMSDVQPAVTFNKKQNKYTIIVGAEAMRGQLLPYDNQPKTLTELTKKP